MTWELELDSCPLHFPKQVTKNEESKNLPEISEHEKLSFLFKMHVEEANLIISERLWINIFAHRDTPTQG